MKKVVLYYILGENRIMKQLEFLFKKEKTFSASPKSCAFTGHRHLGEDFSARKLKKEIKKMMEAGAETFYNGMAMGFDLLAAEQVLDLKKKFPEVKLVACVPCYGQEKYFPEEDKERYARILKKADEVVTLSDHYYNGCMQNRDRYMVDRADALIAYCRKEEGGAAYTVKYFLKTKNEENIVYV